MKRDVNAANILVIGAGATGQVYGRHLALGGAAVSVFVRPKYKDDHPDGFRIYPMRSRDVYEPVMWKPHAVLTSFDEVARATWQQVWLCVPTPSLTPSFLNDVAACTGDATIVLFAGGVSMLGKFNGVLPSERVVRGMIPMMSYFAPMEGESDVEPGVAYWLPPFAKTNFAGPAARRIEVIRALKRGGFAAGSNPKVEQAGAVSSAILLGHVVALEGAQWSYDKLAARGGFADSIAAAKEGARAAATELGAKVPILVKLLRPWLMTIVIALLRRVAPIDVEKFFKTHFSKIGAQVRNEIADYIALAEKNHLSSQALRRLSARALSVETGVDDAGTSL